ncbi:MAG: hypothetical protein LBH75_04655 [Treponema sp.]|jgi:hypothetical protein|nr:hypothetical protein [Treponema sp.]
MLMIKFDADDWMKRTEKVRKELPKVGKKMMAAVFSRIRRDVRTNIRANFKRDTGFLYKNINYYAFEDFGGMITTMDGKSEEKRKITFYASFLEHGFSVSPKGDGYLTIPHKKGGVFAGFRKERSFTVPPRPFFEPVVNDWFSGRGGKAERLMDEILQKEINKYVEKRGTGAPALRD